MNLPVTHAWRKGHFKSAFGINCTKILVNFFILPNITYNHTKNAVRDGLQ